MSSKSTALAQYPDKVELITEIANLLQRLSLLYQIDRWGMENSVALAGWIYDNYKGYRINDVLHVLKDPPTVIKKDGEIENQWRLTPDTINKWMEIQIGKVEAIPSIEPPQIELPEKPDTHAKPIDVDKMLEDFKRSLLDSKVKSTPQLTPKEIREEGQATPPRKKAAASAQYLTTKEQAEEKELRRNWMLECFDIKTGKPNDRHLEFDSWIKKIKH